MATAAAASPRARQEGRDRANGPRSVDEALADVLLRMQRSRLHLASVVDGDRRTVGLVSLEDVLESVVGDIRDESDAAGPGRG